MSKTVADKRKQPWARADAKAPVFDRKQVLLRLLALPAGGLFVVRAVAIGFSIQAVLACRVSMHMRGLPVLVCVADAGQPRLVVGVGGFVVQVG